MFLNDTIAAIATPVGEGGIGIVRVSGPKAKNIGLSILKKPNCKFYSTIEERRIYYGLVEDPQTELSIDEVLFFFAQRPHSFTAEDTLEIQAHGGRLNLAKILELVLDQGARLAEPGEFTLRAYLNGRIDLVQAESIIDLIRAKTEKAHQLAINQLTGKTTEAIHQIEKDLYQILIAVEAVLDFPEEGLPELTKNTIINTITLNKSRLQELLATINEGCKICEGISVVIVGRPNVGKSSLINLLLQEERSIVTDIPGTTRDVIEAQIQMQGIPIRLYDTAGLHDTTNPVEQIGIKKAKQYLEVADLVLMVLEGNKPLQNTDRLIIDKISGKKIIFVINKIDLPPQLERSSIPNLTDSSIVELSALQGEGLTKLEQTMIDAVGIGKISVDDRPILSRVRHKKALVQAIDSLQSCLDGLELEISEDLLAVDIRASLVAIGEITGTNVSEEVLHGIFAQFCIGK